MRNRIKIVICMLPLLLSGGPLAQAQTIIGLGGDVVLSSSGEGPCFAAAVSPGLQMKMALLQASMGYDTGHKVFMSLSFLPRIYGDREHEFNLYLGAGAAAAVIPAAAGRHRVRAGIYPSVQAEVFLTGKVALYAEIPFYMTDGITKEMRYSLGVRYMI